MQLKLGVAAKELNDSEMATYSYVTNNVKSLLKNSSEVFLPFVNYRSLPPCDGVILTKPAIAAVLSLSLV